MPSRRRVHRARLFISRSSFDERRSWPQNAILIEFLILIVYLGASSSFQFEIWSSFGIERTV